MFGHEILHKMASIYMVIRNEVKVMLFRLSAPRIFDQDCRLRIQTPHIGRKCSSLYQQFNKVYYENMCLQCIMKIYVQKGFFHRNRIALYIPRDKRMCAVHM